jgi:hypothetical protein
MALGDEDVAVGARSTIVTSVNNLNRNADAIG